MMGPPSKDTLRHHLCLFQAQVELVVEEGRCTRQKSSVDCWLKKEQMQVVRLRGEGQV